MPAVLHHEETLLRTLLRESAAAHTYPPVMPRAMPHTVSTQPSIASAAAGAPAPPLLIAASSCATCAWLASSCFCERLSCVALASSARFYASTLALSATMSSLLCSAEKATLSSSSAGRSLSPVSTMPAASCAAATASLHTCS